MTTLDIIRKTKAAWSVLRDADAETKNRFLTAMADSLVDHTAEILACNETDLEAARGRISDVMLDRLRLDEGRIAAMGGGYPGHGEVAGSYRADFVGNTPRQRYDHL